MFSFKSHKGTLRKNCIVSFDSKNSLFGASNLIYEFDGSVAKIKSHSIDDQGYSSGSPGGMGACQVGSAAYAFGGQYVVDPGGNYYFANYNKSYKWDGENYSVLGTGPSGTRGSAATLNGIGYIFGGMTGWDAKTDIYSFNGTALVTTGLELWGEVGGPPHTPGNIAPSACALPSSIVIFGGYNYVFAASYADAWFNFIQTFDGATMTVNSQVLNRRAHDIESASIGDAAYIFGGQQNSSTQPNSILLEKWQNSTVTVISTTFPVNFDYGGGLGQEAKSLNGKIYLSGYGNAGYSGSTPINEYWVRSFNGTTATNVVESQAIKEYANSSISSSMVF